VRDLGNHPIRLSDENGIGILPFGVNFAIRSEQQRRYLYDTRLGPKPASSVRSEEVTLVRTMLKLGLSGWWVPTARVAHYVPANRQTISYLRSFYFGQGEYQVVNEQNYHGPMLFGKPRWLWKAAVQAELKYRFHRCFHHHTVWIEDLMRSSALWGNLRLSLACPHRR